MQIRLAGNYEHAMFVVGGAVLDEPETNMVDEDDMLVAFGDDASFAAGVASVDANNDGPVDEFPIISIVDGNAMVLMQGLSDQYTDSGVNCYDQEDRSLSHQVEASGQVVNINIPGTYAVSYDCSDSDGNAAQTKNRTVFVIPPTIADENEDGFDDDGFIAGAQSGDVNLDGILNISDIVLTIDKIINGE